MNLRKTAQQILDVLMIASAAFMLWKGASILTETESPVVVVLSESMEPAIHRGDLLFLTLEKNKSVQINDICVFKLSGASIPIVHRVMKVHQSSKTRKEYILTKGDHNPIDDRGLYGEGIMWIHKENIIGTVKGYVPYVGMLTIWMNDYPWLKFVAFGTLTLFTLIA